MQNSGPVPQFAEFTKYLGLIYVDFVAVQELLVAYGPSMDAVAGFRTTQRELWTRVSMADTLKTASAGCVLWRHASVS